jgi:ABC-2 type transport system ATP-binding protein
MAVIELNNLTKRFESQVAVDHLSFKVEQGGIVGFLGPNGAGKTTTLRMLLSLMAPNEGTATINGRAYHDLSDPLREVGALLEASNAHPGRTARNHLRIHAMNSSLSPSRTDDVLDLVDLGDAADRRVGGFSLGMRQRLGLATALLGDPEILVLDEPTNGLDPEGVRWLRNLLRSLAREGRTVLVSSHLLAEVAQTVDAVVIIDRGHLIAQATLEELTSKGGDAVRVRTPRPEDLKTAVVATTQAEAHVTANDEVQVTGVGTERIGTIAADLQIPILAMTTEATSLEDMFLRLTGDESPQEATR